MSDEYDLTSVKLPYLAGGTLKIFASLIEGALGGLMMPGLFESAGINWLRKQSFTDAPTLLPIHFTGELHTESSAVPEKEWPQKPSALKGFQFTSVYDHANAYRDGKTTPEEVAHKVLDAVKQSDTTSAPLRAFIAVYSDDVIRQNPRRKIQPSLPD
jgi:hypothetical protein